MALENLTPENRVERLLSGADLEPATRLEYFLKQAGSGGGKGLPAYDDEDIGKVLTVGSEYETGAEAIPAQTVTIAQGTATVQNANVSQWTEGQSLQVIYRGTTYTGQITDAEGSLVFETADFALSYDSSTGVLTVEDNEHSGDNTISAQYLTEHANADWSEPSGGSGNSVLFVKPTGEVVVLDESGVVMRMAVADKSTDEINAACGAMPIVVCFPNIERFTTEVDTPVISLEGGFFNTMINNFTDGKPNFRQSSGGTTIMFVYDNVGDVFDGKYIFYVEVAK